MGKAHSNAYQTLGVHDLAAAARAAARRRSAGAPRRRWPRPRAATGSRRRVTDWRELVSDGEVQLFDNSGPNNLHAEPTIAAAEAGKHVICEKPLARTADESYDVWQRVAATGVKHMCAFNYRFVPAVRLAREMLEAGDLGEIYHFRGRYLQEWGDIDDEVWRFDKSLAGSGALGDLGAHVIDLARYLVGEVESVSAHDVARSRRAATSTTRSRPPSEFENGAVGTLEASRFCPGRKNGFAWEINGSKGSIAFDLERLNELQVHLRDSKPGERAQGFRTVLVSEADHPFWEHWWPHGHIIGWEHTFVHELHHLLTAIATDGNVAPARGHVRGRIPSRRGLRRDRAVERLRPERDGHISLSASSSSRPASEISCSPTLSRTPSRSSRRPDSKSRFPAHRSAAASRPSTRATAPLPAE